MALTGIQIYKLLPKTNCKDCGLPTCLAFAMKLAAKQMELSACPHVNSDAKSQLADAAEPPVRLVTLKADGHEVKSGNETVLFRHEKTFFNKPGLFIRVQDDEAADGIRAKVSAADTYTVRYVGMDLTLDGFAVQSASSDPARFADAVSAVRAISKRPLILIARDPAIMATGLRAIDGESPLIYCADAGNWQAMADLAKQHRTALAVCSDKLDELADLTGKLKTKGVADLVLDPATRRLGTSLIRQTQIRRLALKKDFRPLGYPIIAFPCDASDPTQESVLAAQAIAKYAGFIVLNHFAPEMIYPLLVLRENIFTDPQKPIQVQPGLYEINDPKPGDPVLVTTNFSITYFSVANEVEGAGLPAWLLIVDAEGMSVLTAWAAGKFDAERIAKAVKETGVARKVARKRIVLPGHVAVLSGELEEELPDWEIRVGPREAVDLPVFMKQAL
ncbi:MAG: acetyl-CoA decarbonylase/synthase complex subunit gamma [Chloroflexi bacterium]|nr:acetyl-CoA decarbonylase/synthase complex subunit gamma [Chloroflexota bacterium]MCL5274272.1 acetyl-CoA decarbonylase/synthase complex subunit gamma [Chloroflexota bacterium]